MACQVPPGKKISLQSGMRQLPALGDSHFELANAASFGTSYNSLGDPGNDALSVLKQRLERAILHELHPLPETSEGLETWLGVAQMENMRAAATVEEQHSRHSSVSGEEIEWISSLALAADAAEEEEEEEADGTAAAEFSLPQVAGAPAGAEASYIPRCLPFTSLDAPLCMPLYTAGTMLLKQGGSSRAEVLLTGHDYPGMGRVLLLQSSFSFRCVAGSRTDTSRGAISDTSHILQPTN